MWRILIYIAVLCAIAFGAVWLSTLSGEVTILLPDYVANIDLPVAAALLILTGLAIAVIWWLVATILRTPFRMAKSAKVKKRAKGLQALSRGMIAVGAGDTGQARRYAKQAQKLLGDEPLTLLLNAQVAQVTGDLTSADAAFRKMTANKETQLLGLRGLFVEARRQNDHEAAYTHAREAALLAPAAGWANEAVLEAQCMKGAWTEALEMIDRRVAFGLIDKATAKRQRAVLLTANALAVEQSAPDTALVDSTRALKYAPTLVPAATLAARLLGQRGDARKASKIIEKAWSVNPHPDLAETYIYLKANASAQGRLKRAETLGRLSNLDMEGRLIIAQTAVEAREFSRARDVLKPLLDEQPTIRTCLLMADLEEAEHGAVGLVREWVARAARAPRDSAWIADGIVAEQWAPFSPVSGHIDAFKWQTPPDSQSLPDTSAFDLDMDEKPESQASEAEPTFIDVTPAEDQATPPEQPAEPEQEVAKAPEPEPILADTPAVDPEPETEAPQPPLQPEAVEPIAVTPKPVVFPEFRAPDDPGVDTTNTKKKKR
ncbi:heme biosynthesis HemY N-terminal domain-containing protein [Microvirga sp. W0021]|uniref:Heme biosynthesis HemY N-terminal domain-containing protein n=1 Tax=Hohaiivirga grylli TaxID=3133970 RepID=A0ABV0BES9_9HYPH